MFAVIAYLAAACAANFVVTAFGYAALPFTAAALIPFDLTARDLLHDKWHGNLLAVRMSVLVFSGSLLSWMFCEGSPAVCIASAVAFAVAGAVDTVVYAWMHARNRWVRMNASNICSATADSLCFPLIAFGGVSPLLALSQITLKIAGGVLWTTIFVRLKK